MALVVGPLLGACGAVWADEHGSRRHIVVGILAGALLAEAAFQLIQFQFWTGIDLARTDPQVALVDGIVALVLPFPLLPQRRRVAAYLTSGVVGLLGAALVWGVTELARTIVAEAAATM